MRCSSSSFFERLDRWTMAVVGLGLLMAARHASAEVVPILEPGFFFDYDKVEQPLRIPITEQCETIHLKWGRSGAIGPNPVAPYSMVVYTSNTITPFTVDVGSGPTFDWQVPFIPGTQYQICMWDSNGVPGGCQQMYTVVTNSTDAQPTCQNVTAPLPLKVSATDQTGPLSQYGFTDQCTDIRVLPRSGIPPYTLTVAPPLHPPYNLTVDSVRALDWTVSLPWSYPFFLSVQSADKQMWHFGPLHAGGRGPTDCLAPGTVPQIQARNLALSAGLGGTFGTIIVAALGILVYILLQRRKNAPRSRSRSRSDGHVDAYNTYNNDWAWQPVSRPASAVTRDRSETQSPSSWVSGSGRGNNNNGSSSGGINSSTGSSRGRAYVLHHDAGRAPITVITDASEVVELPPQYRVDSSASPAPASSSSSSAGSIGSAGVSMTSTFPLRDKAQPTIPLDRSEAGPSRRH
ncbi:hypothetical protein MKEN_00991000 [Mycena kentingensis (nom. inval.)]|nr:hypothetical protein MKEN_00991000 [Mycena kentingensis (nom. inval.)]